MTNENTLMVLNDFKVPAATSNPMESPIDDFNDFEGIMMNFPRIKIPGGGSTQFEIPSDNPEKPDYTPAIEGIILFNHNTNAYWEEGSEYDMNTSPACSSPDGKTGYGTPGGACEGCPFNQYGTDTNGGKGKACKNMRSLYILQNNAVMPINLLLPPTSLGAFSEFARNAFLMRKRQPWGSLVRIELRKASNGSNNYAVATFKLLGDFTGEKLINTGSKSNGGFVFIIKKYNLFLMKAMRCQIPILPPRKAYLIASGGVGQNFLQRVRVQEII